MGTSTRTRNVILTTLFFTLFFSCDRIMPGGVWEKYETDLLVEEQSNQGPWGGTRSYHWRSEGLGHFNKRQVIDFSSKGGWTLVDSINYQGEELKGIETNNKPSLTISVGPFEPSSADNYLDFDFPRWTYSEGILYKFKTGWVIFAPGTDNSTEINGFVLITKDGKEMTVYHLWGE